MSEEIIFQKDIDLSKRTSWRVGGAAEYFFEPPDLVSLGLAVKKAQSLRMRTTVLGGGSNVLISDQGVKGLVISVAKLSKIEVISETPELIFWADCGTPKSYLLKLFLKYKLTAAYFLAGIPGQVGGGVVMNAGVGENLKPREFREIVHMVEVLHPGGGLEILTPEKLKWDYRHFEGLKNHIITRVNIKILNEPSADVPTRVRELNQLRLKKQPLEWPSCGSVFRNPLPQHAGKLIELAGLKGKRVGDAQVSEKHANFIINLGEAKAADIKTLIELCQIEVKAKFDIALKTEVVFMGQY